MKSGPALKYVEFINGLPRSDRKRFVLAKLKRCHPTASGFLRETLSPTELSLLDSFYRGYQVAMPETPTRAYASSRVEMALNDLKVSNPSAFNIDKEQLRSKIEAKLIGLLGKPVQKKVQSQVLIFNTEIGPWSVITSIDTPRTFQLRYHHSVGCKGISYLAERTSAFSWMGVKLETYWNYLTSADLDSTAESVLEMCRVFFEAAPKWLEGL
jgi:hypothetical protein